MKLNLTALATLLSIVSACGGDSKPLEGFYGSTPYSNNAATNLECLLRIYKDAVPCTLEELAIIGMETSNQDSNNSIFQIDISSNKLPSRFR